MAVALKTFFLLIGVLFLIPSVALSQESSQKITLFVTVEESKDILPDVLSLPVSVEVTGYREARVVNTLEKIDRAIKKLALTYKGGTYSVVKRCWWEEGKQHCFGYRGTVYYNFELPDAEAQSRVMDTIVRLQKRYGNNVTFTVSEVTWIVSEAFLKKTEEELKMQIIDSANEVTKKLSAKLNRTCIIQEINYEFNRFPVFYPYYKELLEAKKTKEIKTPEPVRDERTISVKALVKVVCE